MSVVLRCPSCGTTGASPGTCEACHDAQRRPFCTSHDPGLWLDGATCPTCEARARDAARAVHEPPPAVPMRRVEVAPRRAPVAVPRDAREDLPAVVEDEAPARLAPPSAILGKLLQAALLARLAPSAAVVERERMPVARTVGGCLSRLVLLVLLVLLAVAAGVVMLGRSML